MFLRTNLLVPFHRWKLPGQTSQLCDGGAGQALRLLLLQECLLCLVYPECSARQEALTSNGHGQPRVEIIPALTVRKHLAIFSWFFRYNTVKVVGFTTLYAISYHLSELHIPLSLRHFTLCIILNNRFTMCRTELCDVFVIILSLFAAWEIVMEGAYWGHSCVSTANLDSLWSTES